MWTAATWRRASTGCGCGAGARCGTHASPCCRERARMSLVTVRPRTVAPRLHGACPATHLLGNGRYSVWLTEAGMGRSSWQGEALSRWTGDRVTDADGWRFWLRDLGLGRTWSPAPGRAPGRGSLA